MLLSLPKEQVAAMVARLEPHQAAVVASAMAKAALVGREEQAAVLREFSRLSTGESTEHLRGATNSEYQHPRFEAAHFMAPHLSVRAIADLLASERPQTIALVASHLPAARGAELISSFGYERQAQVMRAIATMEPTDPAVVAEVAEVLAMRAATPAAA